MKQVLSLIFLDATACEMKTRTLKVYDHREIFKKDHKASLATVLF